MDIQIRRFQEEDIPYKVKWINAEENNRFLHYDLPLNEEKTRLWFHAIKDRKDRADYTIMCDGEPAGLIGLLNIDGKNRKAEFYITMGGAAYKGKGIATAASDLLIMEGYNRYNLNRMFFYTEVENIPTQKLYEKMGFTKEGLLREDLIHEEEKVDRFVYGLLIPEYLERLGKEK